MNRILAASFLLLSAIFCHLSGQDIELRAGYGIGIESLEDYDLGPVSVFDDSLAGAQRPNRSSWLTHQVSVGGRMDVYSFIEAGLDLSYQAPVSDFKVIGGKTTIVEDGTYHGYEIYGGQHHAELRFSPYLGFDLLQRNEHESFRLFVTGNIGYRIYTEDYAYRAFDTTSTTKRFAGEEYRIKTRRTGFLFSAFYGIEWEEFITPTIGYHLTLGMSAPYTFRPSRLRVVEYVSDFEDATPSRGDAVYRHTGSEEIDHSESTVPNEFFRFGLMRFNLGFVYRL